MLERKDNYLLNAVLRRYFRWAALALAAAPILVLGNPAAAQDETVVSSTRVPAITLPAGTKITSFRHQLRRSGDWSLPARRSDEC